MPHDGSRFLSRRVAHPDRLQPRGVATDELEAESGASLGTVLSHTTEVRDASLPRWSLIAGLTPRALLQHLLFGPSLRASQPYMDCLSDHLSGYAR